MTRSSIGMRVALPVLAALMIGPVGSPLVAQSGRNSEPTDYAVHVQNKEVVLFPFDDYAIPFRSGLELKLVEAQRYEGNPVLRRGEPGKPDSTGVAFYGTIMPIGNELRMWYSCAGDREEGFGYTWLRGVRWKVCYATSTDGITWKKPDLGLMDYGGSRQNNLVYYRPPVGEIWACVVLHDPDDPNPARRFKMLTEAPRARGIFAAYSPDGLTWTNFSDKPVITSPLEPSGLVKRNGLYYVVGHGSRYTKRVLVVHASPDFEHWTEASHMGFRRDNVGPLHAPLSGGPTGEQVHLGASLWDRDNVLLGFYGQWHGPSPVSNDRRDLRIDIGLIVSHDVLHYEEPVPDFKIVPSGEEKFPAVGTGVCLAQGQSPQNVGDKTLAWYSIWGPGGADGVRVATWTRDRLGYYSVPAAPTEGQTPIQGVEPQFISCPIRLDNPETKVYINAAELGEHSHITVEILDDKFQEMPDYSGSDSIPITESGLRQQVKWRNRQTVGKSSHPVRLRVKFGGLQMEHAQVYAVYLE